MEPEYILGNEQTLENMQKMEAFAPFSEETVDFLDRLSKALMKHKKAKGFPDVITFAFWCRKASVLEMKKQVSWLPDAEERGVFGRGIAFHVAPSNVAVNFAYSFAASMLAGNSNLVRLPSKAFPQVDCLCEVLGDVLEEMPEFKDRLCFVRYGHEQEITDRFSELSDVRLIWGGDRTIQEIRKSSLKIRGKEIVFADRYSIAVISAADYLLLDKVQKKQKAQEFYNDTYLMDQNACTSPMLIVWKGDHAHVKLAQEEFWEAAWEVIEKKYELPAVQAVKKLQAAYRLAAAFPGAVLIKQAGRRNRCEETWVDTPQVHGKRQVEKNAMEELEERKSEKLTVDNRIFRIRVKELSAELMNYRENSGFFMEYETECLEEMLPVCTNRCQTISYLGNTLEGELRDMIKKHRPYGVDRIVPMGKTMDFSLVWDGYDLIREMSREIG